MPVTNIPEAVKDRTKETDIPDGSTVGEDQSNPDGAAAVALHKGEELAKMMAHGACEAASAARGAIGSAATAVTHGLRAGGRFLEEHSPRQMTEDLTGFLRRHPVSSVLVGFGLGCAVGLLWGRSGWGRMSEWSNRPS